MKPISAADISESAQALSGGLSATVTRAVAADLSVAIKAISAHIKAGRFEEAKADARDLTFTEGLAKSEKAIRKFMRATALTGAGAVDSPSTSVMANGGGFPFEVDKSAVRLTQNMVAHILTRDTRRRVLALISRAERFQKASDPIDPDQLAKDINRYMRGEIRRVVDVSANIVGTRVSAYGMYYEARARGITRYRLDAIVDDRTTDICRELNGRTFSIEEAFTKTATLLSETDPTKQKAMAPFPELDNIRGMTDGQIQAAGHDTPPFHFLCRTVVTMIDTQVEYDPVPEFPTDLSGMRRDDADDMMEAYTPMLLDLLNAKAGALSVAARGVVTEEVGKLDTLEALQYYTKSGYIVLNEAARQNTLPNTATAGYMTLIDQAFEDIAPLSDPVFVYRGVSNSTGNKLEIGKVFQDDGFASTTINPGMATDWKDAVMQIHVPSGQKAIPLEAITKSASEHEFLLPRGTQYRIIGSENRMINNRLVKVVKVVVQGQGKVLDVSDLGVVALPDTDSVVKSDRTPQEDKYTYKMGDLREVAMG